MSGGESQQFNIIARLSLFKGCRGERERGEGERGRERERGEGGGGRESEISNTCFSPSPGLRDNRCRIVFEKVKALINVRLCDYCHF